VNQSAKVANVTGVAAVTESTAVTINATGLTAGQLVTIGGLTYTSTGGTNQAQLIAAFESLAAGATTGAGTGTGTYTGTLTGFSSGAVAGGVITFTSTTASTPVTDLAETDASNAVDALVTTQGVTAVAGVVGVLNGAVDITDVNAASLTAAGTITSASLNNFAAATVNSGALSSLTLAGKGTSVAETAGALTTATATTLALNLGGVTTTGAVTLDTDHTTVNIASTSATNTVQTLTASGATTVGISGDKALVLTNQAFAAAAVITSTSTGAVTLGSTLAVGQKYTGGSGVDTFTLAGAQTKAIATGGGDDVITYAGAFAAGGSLDGGDNTDTLVLTGAQAETATTDATFAGTVSNLEVLKLSAATGAARTINMANGDGINKLSIAGATVGALAVTNAAANFTLEQRALTSSASSVALATDTGSADNVNLAYTAADGFTSTAAFTIANVESLKVTTTDADTTAQTALIVTPLAATSAATVTVSGDMGVSFIGGLVHTGLTSMDASGLTASGAFGGLTWTSGALSAAAAVKGGAAGTNTVDFSAAIAVVTYTGGTGNDVITTATANTKANVITLGNGANSVDVGATANLNGNNTITAGTGNDTVVVGTGNNTVNLGDGTNSFTASTGNNTYTGGSGADTVVVTTGGNTINVGGGSTANSVTIGASKAVNTVTTTSTGVDTLVLSGIQTAGGYYTSLTGWTVGDVINLSGVTTANDRTGAASVALGSKIVLGGVSSFANYLDAAAAANTGATNHIMKWFQFTDGNTYLVVDNSNNTTFSDGVDTVIQLIGLIDLSTSTTTVPGVLTIVTP
jgi:S-layer protein